MSPPVKPTPELMISLQQLAGQENHYHSDSICTGDLRFCVEARDVEDHGSVLAQLDQRRSTGHSLGLDAETGRG